MSSRPRVQHQPAHDAAGGKPCRVRTYQPGDEESVLRLSTGGLLPEQVDYDSREPSTIEQTYLVPPRNHFWVAEMEGDVVGVVALAEIGPDVGHLHWLRVDPAWQADGRVARRLVEAAATHARQTGFLKLVLHVPAGAQERVTAYFQLLGFEFSRQREVDGKDMLELYLNLYAKPQLGG